MAYESLEVLAVPLIVGAAKVYYDIRRTKEGLKEREAADDLTRKLIETHIKECSERREETAALVERVSTIQDNQRNVMRTVNRLDDKLDILLERR